MDDHRTQGRATVLRSGAAGLLLAAIGGLAGDGGPIMAALSAAGLLMTWVSLIALVQHRRVRVDATAHVQGPSSV